MSESKLWVSQQAFAWQDHNEAALTNLTSALKVLSSAVFFVNKPFKYQSGLINTWGFLQNTTF